jgi:hypothetical protein
VWIRVLALYFFAYLRGWGRVLSRRSSWLCGAGIHWALVERGVGEPVKEREADLECQCIHRVLREGRRTSQRAWGRPKVSAYPQSSS